MSRADLEPPPQGGGPRSPLRVWSRSPCNDLLSLFYLLSLVYLLSLFAKIRLNLRFRLYEALIADGWMICAKEMRAGSAHWPSDQEREVQEVVECPLRH